MADWILGFSRGKRSNKVLVRKAIRVLEADGVGSDSMSESSVTSGGSANSEGGSMIRVGRKVVSSVISKVLNWGQERDHAGWLPLQKGHFGSVAGHF